MNNEYEVNIQWKVWSMGSNIMMPYIILVGITYEIKKYNGIINDNWKTWFNRHMIYNGNINDKWKSYDSRYLWYIMVK